MKRSATIALVSALGTDDDEDWVANAVHMFTSTSVMGKSHPGRWTMQPRRRKVCV